MRKGKQKSSTGGGRLFPNSIRIIGSCLRNVSANASTVASTVRSAGATVAASISSSSGDQKDQVTWAGFDKLELESSICRRVLLLGYRNGFQILDVEDASNFSELVSKRDVGLVTFLQMQPTPINFNSEEELKRSHPLLLVVAEDEPNNISLVGHTESPAVNVDNCPTIVRFYSLKSNCYEYDLKFRSPVYMVRCSSRIVAVGLATEIHCYDALSLEKKFSVLTYPVPQVGGQGRLCPNVGYGPMALGSRWLAYASNTPPLLNTGRLSPKSASPFDGTNLSTSPSNRNLVARYAMESGWNLAAGIVNLGDKGYKRISKYYQELNPDGSNAPSFVRSGSAPSRFASAETENAGVVMVKDCVSRAVICQFRAHSSPVSALCFDPSGTLLVTASAYGNTVNIFRIMDSNNSGSHSQDHDAGSSYIHLYKMHRGITAAVIQDICFSQYSQWVAIVSSKGTCHVFALSPFGGDVGFKIQNSQGEEPSLSPVITPPWWSTSTFSANHLSSHPPPPVSPTVVSRIWDNSSGLLNTVSNAAASVSGKSSTPSGALVAVFHNSMHGGLRKGFMGLKSMAHLLVFTPSGHVVQHEICASLGSEQSAGGSRTQSFTKMEVQDVELGVCIQPLQWWDVCRRSDWPEREECVSKIPSRRPELVRFLLRDPTPSFHSKDILETRSDEARKVFLESDSSSCHEQTHGYLSNAEVQYNIGRQPVWQNPKIYFSKIDASNSSLSCFDSGELEIEKMPVSEIEIRRKDLLPVDHFHAIKTAWSERSYSGGKYVSASPSDSDNHKDRSTEEIISHSKPASLTSTESSDGGSSRRSENLIDLDYTEKPSSSFHQTCKDLYHNKKDSVDEKVSMLDEKFDAFCVQNDSPSKTRTPVERLDSKEAPILKKDATNELPSLVSDDTTTDASDMNLAKALLLGDEKQKDGVEATNEKDPEEDDDMLGPMFGFFDEA